MSKIIHLNGVDYVALPVAYPLNIDDKYKGSVVVNDSAPLLYGTLFVSADYSLKPPTKLIAKLYSHEVEDLEIKDINIFSDYVGTLKEENLFFDSLTIDTNFDVENTSVYFRGWELLKIHKTKKLQLLPAVNNAPYTPNSGGGGTVTDVVDDLISNDIDKALSANQGRILKGFVDAIDSILSSDDVSLDELQEIVDFIQQNKAILDTLAINNIAGLQTALDNKMSVLQFLPTKNADFSIVDAYNQKIIPIGTSCTVTIPDNLTNNNTFGFLIKDGITVTFVLANNVVTNGNPSLVHLGQKSMMVSKLDNEIFIM